MVSTAYISVISEVGGTYPRMPSKPSKPTEELATPMPWFVMTRSGLSVTVSVYSSPDHPPEP